jgi:peptide deformylase
MTKDDIITLPNKHLRTPSKRVGIVTDEIKQIIEDMKAATLDWEAGRQHEVSVALAAVQIDVLLRIVILREDFKDKDNHNFHILINPEITKYEGKIEEDYEGCLSIKHVYGIIPRHTKVRVKAKNLQGKEFTMKVEGFPARILQHEIDHTKGIVIIDHIKDVDDAFFKLEDDGKLNPLDYEKDIKNSRILW